MKERTIEQKLVEAVRHAGGLAPKFTSPGLVGVPDRIVLLPDGKLAFVEVKTHGKKPRPVQNLRKRQLELLGYKVFVLDDTQKIKDILKDIQGGGTE